MNFVAPFTEARPRSRGLNVDSGELRGRRSTGPSSWPATTGSARSRRRAASGATPSSSGSGCPPTSRCAAWRRRDPGGAAVRGRRVGRGHRAVPAERARSSCRTGTSPHGQGHVTSWAQIVADELGVTIEDVEVLHGDTQVSPLGLDTYGSRSVAVGATGPVPRPGEDQGEGEEDRRARAGGLGGRPRVRGRRVPGQGGARPGPDDPGARRLGVARPRPPGRNGAQPGRHGGRATRRTSRGRPGRTSAWSRWTPRPATVEISTTWPWTTAGR